jgi:3-oxoacyl-[acyl-carrier protein] reductase
VRNVLVTGGSRGLGLAIASRLAACGYRVIALARSETDELRAAMALSEHESRLTFHAYDLTQTAGIGDMVAELRRQVGPLYGLVNNAGLGTAGLLSMMRDPDIEALVRLNTLSPLLLTKYVVRAMMAERQGRIVNISSIVASSGYKGLSAYSATKAALEGFTRSLAREVGQLGITVNAVAPGFVDTAMTHAMADSEREQIARRSALRRMVEASDVASAVEYLLGEKARNITGIVLTVDAGNTA